MDIALVSSAVVISTTYVVEIESICLIDQITGDRARLLTETLAQEKEIAELYGLPAPTTIEDPQYISNTGGWLVVIVGLTVAVLLAYNVKVWGLPRVIVALAITAYTIITVLV